MTHDPELRQRYTAARAEALRSGLRVFYRGGHVPSADLHIRPGKPISAKKHRAPESQQPARKSRLELARVEPLAVRAPQAAAMLGISESKLRALVAEGRIRPPVEIDALRLFDVEQLRADWASLRDAALADDGANPWDGVASDVDLRRSK